MKENNGNGKKYSNPPTNFKPREQYKFLKERGNNKLSCETCNFNFNDEDEVRRHIIETHEKNRKDAFIKECSEMVTNHGKKKLHLYQVLPLSVGRKLIYLQLPKWSI